MAKRISELPVVEMAQAADKVLINHNGTTSTILVENLLPEEVETDALPMEGSSRPVSSGGVYSALEAKQDSLTFDDSPTEGSSNPVSSGGVYEVLEEKQDSLTFDSTPVKGSTNPVTSGGIYTALETAGAIPDWDESDETAADYIKNRPFYREVASSTTIFSKTGSEGRTTSTNGTWDFSESYSTSARLVVGQEYRVKIHHASGTFEERITASQYSANYIRLTGSTFYIEQDRANYQIMAAMSRSAFGTGSNYFTVQIIQDTFSYKKLPEEYLDTSFAAPEFSDAERVSESSANYADAYMLLFRNGTYYRNKYADAFTARLTASGLTTRVGNLENSTGSIWDALDSFAENMSDQLTALKNRVKSVENDNRDQEDLISDLRAQIRTLQSRVTYLESLHADGDVIVTEADSVLSFDGTGVSVVDGELVINSANVSVLDDILVYGIGSAAVMSIDADGTLSLDGNGVSVEDGDLDINSDDISVSDEVLTTGENTQAEVTDGTVDMSGAAVDEAGVCDLGEAAVVEDEVITM